MQRLSSQVPSDFLASTDCFSFDAMKPSGGKGGDMMVWTKDGKYIIKEVNAGDQTTLLKVSQSYADHVTGENGTSLICRFFLHFKRFEDDKDYVVMGNCLPKPKLFPTASGEMAPRINWTALYDLKAPRSLSIGHPAVLTLPKSPQSNPLYQGCRDDKSLILDGDDVEEVCDPVWTPSHRATLMATLRR